MPTFTSSPHPLENRLLAILPSEEYDGLRPHLDNIAFTLSEVIYESGGQQSFIYFPTTAIISLLYLMENGSSAEIGVVGNEGVVGIALFMGGATTLNRAVVQSAGSGLRMKAKVLQDEFARGGTFQRQLLRYTQALITQIVTDSRLQSSPYTRSTTLALVAAEP